MNKKPIEGTTLSQAIHLRKSTREFDDQRSIDRNILEQILQAALRAPSPKNRQPWHFTVVESPEMRQELASILSRKLQQLKELRGQRKSSTDDLELAAGSVRAMECASVLVFVEYLRNPENDHNDNYAWSASAQPFEAADIQSIGAAIENMLIEATCSGVASLWMCDVLYAMEEYSQLLGIRGPLVAAVALGYEALHHTHRASLREKVTFLK